MKECPAYITGEARRFWFAQGPALVTMGTLKEVDFPAFEDLCLSHGEKVHLILDINRLRAKKKRSAAQAIELQTLESQRRKATAQFQKIAGEFGMTAASRPRIKLPDNQMLLAGIAGSTEPIAQNTALDRATALAGKSA